MMDMGMLLKMQGVTSHIKARIHSENNRKITIHLDIKDPPAAQ